MIERAQPNQTEIFKKIYEKDDMQTYNTEGGIETYQKAFGLTEQQLTELSGKKVVDIGAGEGIFVKELREKGAQAIGIDKKPLAKNHLLAGAAEKLPLKNSSIDAVFMHRLISNFRGFVLQREMTLPEAIYSAVELIKEVYRILKEGGVAYIQLDSDTVICRHKSARDDKMQYRGVHIIEKDGEKFVNGVLSELNKLSIPYEITIDESFLGLTNDAFIIVSLKIQKIQDSTPTQVLLQQHLDTIYNKNIP